VSEAGERRLAAILSADAVGYSRRMAEDEGGTVAAIEAARARVVALVPQHRGRLVDFTGDNFLAEFPTALDATHCALALQAALGSDAPLRFRAGVHLGDVRIEGERLYGDGVNVAARLAAAAEPGGLCISAAVHEQVLRRVDARFEDLGERRLKNIPEPVHAFRVLGAGERPALRRRGWLVAAVVALPAAAVLAFVLLAERYDAGSPAKRSAERTALAVLPFDNMSGDPEQTYFADGMAEDLLTRLAAFPGLRVIARNSSFLYRGGGIDVQQVGRELGADYVLEGSVRRADDRVRVTAQLIDAASGHHVWAERYDRELADVFELQDELSSAIAGSMLGEIEAREQDRVLAQDPRDLDAWDLTLRANWHLLELTRKDNARARELAERAIALDPRLGRAHGVLSLTHSIEVFQQWTGDPEGATAEALRTARNAVAADATDAAGHVALAAAYSLTGDREEMLASARTAVELNPSLPQPHLILASALLVSGRGEEAIERIEHLMEISPRDANRWTFFDVLVMAHFALGSYGETARWARRIIDLKPSYLWGHLALAAAEAQVGHRDAARAALDGALRLQPDLSLEAIEASLSTLQPETLGRFLEGLRGAGWEG
jgi:adenylate cyclase